MSEILYAALNAPSAADFGVFACEDAVFHLNMVPIHVNEDGTCVKASTVAPMCDMQLTLEDLSIQRVSEDSVFPVELTMCAVGPSNVLSPHGVALVDGMVVSLMYDPECRIALLCSATEFELDGDTIDPVQKLRFSWPDDCPDPEHPEEFAVRQNFVESLRGLAAQQPNDACCGAHECDGDCHCNPCDHDGTGQG